MALALLEVIETHDTFARQVVKFANPFAKLPESFDIICKETNQEINTALKELGGFVVRCESANAPVRLVGVNAWYGVDEADPTRHVWAIAGARPGAVINLDLQEFLSEMRQTLQAPSTPVA